MKVDPTTPSAQVQGGPKPAHRILVVDDDIGIRQLSAEALIGSGYQVDVAEDGATGWGALQAGRYDLLITDNNMPKISGVELVRKLRSARMALPVILATGTLPANVFAQSPWLIPDATLLKPFTIGGLLGMVKAVLHLDDTNAARPAIPLSMFAESVRQSEPPPRRLNGAPSNDLPSLRTYFHNLKSKSLNPTGPIGGDKCR